MLTGANMDSVFKMEGSGSTVRRCFRRDVGLEVILLQTQVQRDRLQHIPSNGLHASEQASDLTDN